MLTWPHSGTDWQPWLNEVEQVYAELAFYITQVEKLLIVCNSDAHRAHIQTVLANRKVSLKQISFFIIPADDSWSRDHGPISIYKDNKPHIIDFGFNAWGNKYEYHDDDLITQRLYNQKAFNNIDIEASNLILEGGSVDSDGQGNILTTEHCLLSPQRNPQLDKNLISTELEKLLGIKNIFWLSHGIIVGDDTDSHIDMLARFCDPETIAYTSCDDPDDEHYQELTLMRAELETLKTLSGQAYKLIPLPIPAVIYNQSGQRLPASYANFLIINGMVLVPVYNDANDEIAIMRLQKCFKDRKVIAIDCRALINQYGSLHCISMQLPEGVLN